MAAAGRSAVDAAAASAESATSAMAGATRTAGASPHSRGPAANDHAADAWSAHSPTPKPNLSSSSNSTSLRQRRGGADDGGVEMVSGGAGVSLAPAPVHVVNGPALHAGEQSKDA